MEVFMETQVKYTNVEMKDLTDLVIQEMKTTKVNSCELEFDNHSELLEFLFELRQIPNVSFDETSSTTLNVTLNNVGMM